MKTKILPFLFAASLLASCKKNDKAPEPPKEFIQLQKIEFSDGILNLSYNDQHQLTKAEIVSINENQQTNIVGYISYIYENGLPGKAEVHARRGDGYRKETEYHFKLDQQKRISYVAMGRLSENGNMQWGDTTDFTYNSNNQIIATQARDQETPVTFAYDSKGNFKEENTSTREGNNIFEYKYEQQYDNNSSPFAVNGLGLMLFSVFRTDFLEAEQILSVNNPMQYKTTFLRKMVDENGTPTYTYEITTTRDYTNTLDENGGLKLVTLKTTNLNKENGNITNSSSNQHDIKFTCIKKQQ